LRQLQGVLAVLFLLLVLRLAGLQSPWSQARYATRLHQRADGSALANPRLDDRGQVIPSQAVRGRFLDRCGRVLAVTTPRGRHYPHRSQFIHLLGFETPDHQRVGLERFLHGLLLGQWDIPRPVLRPPRLTLEQRGYDVVLTLDQALQARACQLLEAHGYTGCIVGMVPRTGEILIAANRPTLDPATVTAEEWLAAYDNKRSTPPFCYRRVYPPGSTFKTLVAAAALDEGVLSPTDSLLCRGFYQAPGRGRPIHDFQRRHRGHGACTLAEALVPSCNSIYAEVGVRLGWPRLSDFADRAGFNRYLPLVPETWRGERKAWLETSQSVITPGGRWPAEMKRSERQPVFLAQTALGQRNVRMTPLHLALWTATIANGGRLMAPSVVKAVVDPQGQTLWRFQPQVLSQAMSENTARQLAAMMEQVVGRGTGRPARVAGLRIAGKTGTPEEDAGSTNALFIAFAPVDQPRLAVAVVIEGARGGGATAGPLAAELLQAACE
jgi:peptidoglycan glycosyltransferase